MEGALKGEVFVSIALLAGGRLGSGPSFLYSFLPLSSPLPICTELLSELQQRYRVCFLGTVPVVPTDVCSSHQAPILKALLGPDPSAWIPPSAGNPDRVKSSWAFLRFPSAVCLEVS